MLGVSALSGAAIGDLGIVFENASASAAATTTTAATAGYVKLATGQSSAQATNSANSTRVRTGGAISGVESSFAGVGIRLRNVSGTSTATATTSATAGYVKRGSAVSTAAAANSATFLRVRNTSAEALANLSTSADSTRVRESSSEITALSDNTASAGYVKLGEGLISLTSSVSAIGRKKWKLIPEGASTWTTISPESDAWTTIREDKDIEATSVLPNTFGAFAFSERPLASNDRSEVVIWAEIA
jgi:hypothetical protein